MKMLLKWKCYQSALKTRARAQPWSKWTWQPEYNRYYRSRYGDSGDLEYEYDYITPGPGTAKGKGKRESGGSEDELAWDQSTVDTRTWSEWIWEENNGRYYRSRLGDSGKWEYEYDYNTAGPAKERGSRKETGKGKEKRRK